MRPLAQTNVQLFNQLTASGFTARDVGAVRDAYVLAAQLFSGLFRPSGKTFVAHVVGTASALADANAPLDAIVAGLLHAAYTHGDFGTLRRRIDATKRRRVRAVAGTSAERLTYAYATEPWGENVVRDALAASSDPDATRRDVHLLRLANELDDADDRAGLYTARWSSRLDEARRTLPLCAAYARRLEVPELARRLEAAAAATLATAAPLPQTFGTEASLVIVPASLRPGVRLAARRAANRLRAVLSRRAR